MRVIFKNRSLFIARLILNFVEFFELEEDSRGRRGCFSGELGEMGRISR